MNVRRVLAAVAVGAALLFPAGNASADTYYGTLPAVHSSAGWLGDNPYYNVMSATNHMVSLKVYDQNGLFAFFNAGTGFLYTDYGPCGLWLCDDAGAPLSPNGWFAIHCYPGAPGYFSMLSVANDRWAVMEPVAGGWTPEFISGTDPVDTGNRAGLFYSYLGKSGWCWA